MSNTAATPGNVIAEGDWRLHDMEGATIVVGKPGREVANCLNGFGDRVATAEFIIAMQNIARSLSPKNPEAVPGVMVEAVKLLERAYQEKGPRTYSASCDVMPAHLFARLTPQEIDAQWDFEDRHFMHEIAVVLNRLDTGGGDG